MAFEVVLCMCIRGTDRLMHVYVFVRYVKVR